jgi:hypothetical protein
MARSPDELVRDIDYDGRVFRSSAAETAIGVDTPIGYYHQQGELVWAEFAGGAVRIGRLTGVRRSDGTIRFVYGQVLTDGRLVAGECVSTPELLPDGRVRLREQWRRFDDAASTGVSYIEETRDGAFADGGDSSSEQRLVQ